MNATKRYVVNVVTPEWSGRESFQYEVKARDESHAREQAEQLIDRDLPQGGKIVSVLQ